MAGGHHRLRSLSKLQETVQEREAWHAAVHGVTKSDTTEQLNNNCSRALMLRPKGGDVGTPEPTGSCLKEALQKRHNEPPPR